jgi:hypothetical protein
MARLPDEIKPAMQGVAPSKLATCAKDGTPNVTTISQIFWVDDEHVALSFQFFNKTIKNVRENPRAQAFLLDPTTWTPWLLDIRYERSETEGEVFDAMDMQLEAIASMTGMAGVFKLKAADIYFVEGVHKLEVDPGA